ncbi:MAG TPA: hypothetical protein VLZ03_12095, partial [Thermodesulfobacteriota bacterium]|nr:hypothetical protein [Thermodesulfobacteriota bacterium]
QLNGVDEIASLDADHESFKRWRAETKTILETVFRSKSVHSQSFLALRFREMSVQAFASTEIQKINAARYKKDLEIARNILQSAIKELTLDRTLFKKIQTTPETVEISLKGEYFISSGIQESSLMEAIKAAFEGSGLTPILGAEISPREESIHQRIEQIKRTRFGIYDVSTPDKTNTLLELGAALGMGKEAVILHKKGSPLPETMKHLNRIEYENLTDLAERLKKRVPS